MLDTLINIDTNIFLALNSLHAAFFDAFMYVFSSRWVWVPTYMVIAAVIIRLFGWRNGIFVILCAATAVALSDQTCASYIRPIVKRLRPANPDNPISALVHIVNDYRGGKYGFPSCHAANTFAFATFIALVFRNRWVSMTVVLWAIFNCYSRIYLGVHYPGDLLVGGCIGALYGCLMFGVMSACVKYLSFFSTPKRQFCNTATYRRVCLFIPAIVVATATGIAIYGTITLFC